MASKRKTKKRTKRASPDLEAIGLVLVALGIFVFALLLPALPTGALGEGFRGAVARRIGWGALTLPWPLLVLGGVFLLRRNPKGWPLALAGYLVLAFGGWLLLSLLFPAAAGVWGVRFRQAVTGATGLLAYVLALLIVASGLELLFKWPPTRIVRTLSRWGVQGVRGGYKGAVNTRRRVKRRTSLGADAALVRKELRELSSDLATLHGLYLWSVEIEGWQAAVEAAGKRLKGADEATLTEVQADIEAWREAVRAYTQDRAEELRFGLEGEGIDGFTPWLNSLKEGLERPFETPPPLSRALDSLRQALALDLTALSDRYRRLIRERDLAEASLEEARPQTLLTVSKGHEGRLLAYREATETAERLTRDADRLDPWHSLCHRLASLVEETEGEASERLRTFNTEAARELRERGREALGIDPWEERLNELLTPLQSPLEPETPEVPSSEEPTENAFTAADEPEDTPPWEEPAEPLPEVGGIPIQLPNLHLLDAPAESDLDPVAQNREVQARVAKIDTTLGHFKRSGRVVASVRGPTVTRFEVEPAPGEQISRFSSLSDDLALAMAVGSVRIEAPIPGKSVIGLEVPNKQRDLIRFREAAEAPSFRKTRARLPLILGKSIDGEMMIADLAKMPHLLIAGSTGSGKSVAVNTLIGSLLYKFLPTDLRLLMIDPKMVELTPFDGIPHLLRPVVTNPNDASGVLLGAVAHMERRYKMMSKIGAKNLDQYNEKARNLDLPEMPFIIIIIDELADLMITSPKEVESAIMRLAQMARATGMHLVLATQRPSVDILTSLIKVNVPARIAFAVSSGHDSRTILDTMGAERLTGMGDMLFYEPGLVKPVRLQGPFISEAEIVRLADFMRRQFFDDDFAEAYGSDFDPVPEDDSSASGLVDWNDDKLRDAAELVISEGQGSVSRLQRRLSVGHARAGKLMDSLEALGVVGPHVGSKPREVLVEVEELPNIFGK